MTRPRIDRLSIQNFRGFADIGHPDIVLGGKNLLVYGENGAGKSSIFHALDGFFSVGETSSTARRKRLTDAENIYSGIGVDKTSVSVRYDGNGEQPITWDVARHPADARQNDRVVQTAYRRAVFDYRSLLEVNYKFLGKRINLFPVFVDTLLRDLPVAWSGGEREFSRIWARATSEFEYYHIEKRKAHIDDLLRAVNDALEALLPRLTAETNRLLALMKWGDLKITEFTRSQLYVNWDDGRPYRAIKGQQVRMSVEQRGEEVPRPHHLLNEARQSALALAVYLAGRIICTATTLQDTPKLMVLDDVLIGLDQSNRLPVLELIRDEFRDWQVVLLTYDRVWFEMARAHLPEQGDHAWTGLEVYEGVGAGGGIVPVLRPLQNFDAVTDNLTKAKSFLDAHHDNAAAVHTRMAFEHSLKRFCDKRGVPVAFKENARELNTQELLTGIEKWIDDKPARRARKPVVDPLIASAKMCRKVVLNAYAHSTPVTLCKAEIEAAINAVRALDGALKAEFPTRSPAGP